jgi:hypothetical protein
MGNFTKCVARIITETGTQLTRAEVEEVMGLLIEDRGIKGKRAATDYADMSNEQQRIHDQIEGPPNNQVLTQARDDVMARLRKEIAQQSLNRYNNVIKQQERFKAYSQAGTAHEGFQAKLIGTNRAFEGSRSSTEAAIKGQQWAIVAPFAKELQDSGLESVFMSRALEKEWAKELGELNRTDPGPHASVTGNKQARALAEIIQRAQQRTLDALRQNGAWIGNYDGYITRTTHSPDRALRMGKDAWVDLAFKTHDLDTIYPNMPAAEIKKQLGNQWQRIATGEHQQFSPQNLELMQHLPGQNMAKKISESRSIHFKDADSWLAFMEGASDETPTSVVVKSLLTGGRDAGLMSVWGTNPKASFLADMQMLRLKAARAVDTDGGKQLRAFERNEVNYRRWFGLMDGELGKPVNSLAARITQNYLALQRTAKLGFLPFAMATHIGTVHGELRYQGVPFLKRITDSVLSFIPNGPVRNEVVQNISSEFHWLTGEMHSMLEGNDMRVGGRFTRGVTGLQNWMFKVIGAQMMNNNLRKSHIAQMASHFGRQRGEDWSSLGMREQRIMKAFDIAEPEWTALTDRETKWLRPSGADQHFLTPDAAHSISDRAMGKMAEDRGMIARDATGEQRDWTPDELNKMRGDLAQKIYRYFADRNDFGAWGHGVGERAILTQGNRPGSALGISLQIMTQYKSFAVFMIRRTLGRDIYGSDSAGEAVSGIVQMCVGTAILGIFQNALTQMLKGQDPTTQWKANPTASVQAAMLRGGGMSILGDFLFSEYNRYDKQGVDWLAGPSAGLINSAVALPHMIARGDKVAGTVLDQIRANIPLSNLFYTKLAMDYLIWNGLTEWAHPGYLQRAERRLEKTQGLQYIPGLHPSQLNVWAH